MVLLTLNLIVTVSATNVNILLYADLARGILMFLLSCVYALKIPHAVCDLTYKTIAVKSEIFAVALDHRNREAVRIRISRKNSSLAES